MRDVFIVAPVRTPIGKFGGKLVDVSPVELGALVMREVLQRASLDGAALDMYIMGNVLRAGHGQLLPRQAAARAGIPPGVDGYSIDMVCSSGMMAVMNAAMMIRAGEADLVLAGGMESMSQAGFSLSHRARWGYKYLMRRPEQLTDIALHDGLTDPIEDAGMGEETDRLSGEYGITRDDVDAVAAESHRRAAAAHANGAFKNEIVPVEIRSRKSTETMTVDEGIRADTSVEALASLRPAFTENGVLTAGSSSQISDGAAALLLASPDAVEQYGLKPVARLHGASVAAVESWRFVEAPIPAVRKLLQRHEISVGDIDLFENNEAFATNSVLMHRELGVSYDKLNIYGGGISLGHPIGATGARLIVTLSSALNNTGGHWGVASLCHGTGGGTAVLIERIQ
jgi:acetyl-CoA C-acetyltransferase